MKKVLMLILASDDKGGIYSKLQGIMRQYVHSKSDAIEAYFYMADPSISDDYKIVGDTIYVKTVETYPNLWKKFWMTLKAFEGRLDEFSFICRPNLSTFFLIDRYLSFCRSLPTTRCCSGLVFYGGQPIPFPAGYLFTISIDIARMLIYNNCIPDNEGIDDRCIGIILRENNIQIMHHNNFIEVHNASEDFSSCLQRVKTETNIFMIRIRSLSHYGSREIPFGIGKIAKQLYTFYYFTLIILK